MVALTGIPHDGLGRVAGRGRLLGLEVPPDEDRLRPLQRTGTLRLELDGGEGGGGNGGRSDALRFL